MSGCYLWKEVEQSRPARSDLESLFPEWLFRREKKHRPNHSRENLPLPEKRESVAKKDCKTPALGKRLLVPKPCRARLWAPSRVPAWPRGPEPRPLTPAVPALRRGHKKTQAGGQGTSQFADTPPPPRGPLGAFGRTVLAPGGGGEGRTGGDWPGQPPASARGPGSRTVGGKHTGTGGGGGQFAATRGREGTSHCIPVPGPPRPPHCAHRPPGPGPSLQQPSGHRASWPPPEPCRALLSGQPGQAERGVTSCILRSGGSVSTLSELFCSEIPGGSRPTAPPTLQGLRRGYGVKSGPHSCLRPTYCVLDWENSEGSRQAPCEDAG